MGRVECFDNFVCVLLKIGLLVTKASKASKEVYISSFYMCCGKNVNIITINKPFTFYCINPSLEARVI